MNYQTAQFIASYGLYKQIPESTLPEIVFAGRSNVGKSSMLNKIFQRKKLARVSSEPGKTATINFYRVEDVHFVDLPGYGYARASKSQQQRWSKLTERYFQGNRNIVLVVLLIDMRHPPTVLDLQMIDFLKAKNFLFTILLTKSDKLKKTKQKEQLKNIAEEIDSFDQNNFIPFSSATGEGVTELRSIIEKAVSENK